MPVNSAFDRNQHIHSLEEFKKVYEQEMETQLGELGVRLQEWTRRAESLNLNGVEGLKSLRQWHKNAVRKLHDLKYEDVEEWAQSKEVLDETWHNLQIAWKEFKSEANEFKRNNTGNSRVISHKAS